MQHILIYEPGHEQAAQLLTLFQSAKVCFTHVRSSIEALNWLAATRLRIVDFDLVVVGSLINDAQERLLLGELCSVQLPVIYLQQRQEPIPLKIQNKVIACRIEDLPTCVADCLTKPTLM